MTTSTHLTTWGQKKFYILSKIRKPADSWTIPMQIPKCFPLCHCSCEYDKIVEFINQFLKLKSNPHPFPLKTHWIFLKKISNIEILENSLLITLMSPVSSLQLTMPTWQSSGKHFLICRTHTINPHWSSLESLYK